MWSPVVAGLIKDEMISLDASASPAPVAASAALPGLRSAPPLGAQSPPHDISWVPPPQQPALPPAASAAPAAGAQTLPPALFCPAEVFPIVRRWKLRTQKNISAHHCHTVKHGNKYNTCKIWRHLLSFKGTALLFVFYILHWKCSC